MADKSVGELVAATSVTPTDLFVLEQSGTAKKLTGQILENWLVSFADGHGGIQSIAKLSSSGLADTYRITLADTTTFDFVVNNGKGITGISKTGTSGLMDTYTISYNNGTTSTFTVTNGAKGDKGDNTYTWIKYASQEPTEESHSMGDIPDNWIGIYYGNASTAPTDWQQYQWFKHKGEQGDTGAAATLVNRSVTYQVSDSGTIIPSGAWASSVPVVSPGKYLWTKTELQFNTGDPIVSYSVGRMGIDGSGSVSSVAGVFPDSDGNVTMTAANVGALPTAGGSMEGPINMNGQPISGLNDPTDATHAARKSYVDKMLTKTGGTMTGSIAMGGNKITDLGTPTANTDAATKGYVDTSVAKAAPRNLLDNSDFRNPVNQRGGVSYTGKPVYTIDRWKIYDGTLAVSSDGYVSYTGQFFQYIDGVEFDKPYTFAVGLVAGIVCVSGKFSDQQTASLGNTKITMVVSNDYGEVVLEPANGSTAGGAFWAALYEGEYTAETLPEYHPKGYGAELLECQRYFRWLNIGGAVNGNYIGYRIPLSPVMRTNPSTTGFNLTATSGQATITAGGYSAESDCFRMDAYIGSDADKWWACDVALSADL